MIVSGCKLRSQPWGPRTTREEKQAFPGKSDAELIDLNSAAKET